MALYNKKSFTVAVDSATLQDLHYLPPEIQDIFGCGIDLFQDVTNLEPIPVGQSPMAQTPGGCSEQTAQLVL